jgi:lipoyl(octanoyl) transferase
MNTRPELQFQDIGRRSFGEAWEIQEALFRKIVDRKIEMRKTGETSPLPLNHLLFVEHDHVFTLGKSGSPENLKVAQSELMERGIDYHKINRGGDITYHGPGQIVAYPILDLDQFFTDIHRYLRTLEEAVIRTLAEYGIVADRYEGYTGVWIDPSDPQKARKICALGVRCSRWVTMHGLAFNVNADLPKFDLIVPCGIQDKAVTSMDRELGESVEIERVKERLLVHLTELFNWRLID